MQRALVWAAGIAALLLAAAMLYQQHLALGVALLVASFLIPGLGETMRDRKRRQGWFESEIGSAEKLRDSVDASVLRAVRDEKGVPAAVREVRRQFPDVPLTEANRLVRGL